MSETFDPYHKWLGIAPNERPIHFYRLLGVNLFEDDVDVISVAADRQMAHVKTFATGKYAQVSQKILNELGQAKVCLTDFEAKLNYDTELRNHMSGPAPHIETESRTNSELFDELNQLGDTTNTTVGTTNVATPIRVPTRVTSKNEFPVGKLIFGLLGTLLALFLTFTIAKSIATYQSRSKSDYSAPSDYKEVVDRDVTLMADVATRSLERFDCQIDLSKQPTVQCSDNHYFVTTPALRDGELIECILEYWRDDSQGSPRWKLTRLVANGEVLHESP